LFDRERHCHATGATLRSPSPKTVTHPPAVHANVMGFLWYYSRTMRVSMSRVLFCVLLALVVFAPGQLRTSTAMPVRILVLNSAEESARVRAQLENGADFAVLAREKSVDATSLDGGLLGNVDPSTLREEIR